MHTFSATDSLIDVNRHILLNQSGQNMPYSLMTTFPRKVFTEEDHNKTLKELGMGWDSKKLSDRKMSSLNVVEPCFVLS